MKERKKERQGRRLTRIECDFSGEGKGCFKISEDGGEGGEGMWCVGERGAVLETGSGGGDKALQEWGGHWGVFVRGGVHRVLFVVCVCG